jgi:hypothetical protein
MPSKELKIKTKGGVFRTEFAWGIAHEEEGLLPWTIRLGRKFAISDFCKSSGYDIPEGVDAWRWLKRQGNRCVPVTLSYVTTSRPGRTG